MLEAISTDFLKKTDRQYDPQFVRDAQTWYTRFTGGIGNASRDDIIEMYLLLAKIDEKSVDK
jgi:hypothetical protein